MTLIPFPECMASLNDEDKESVLSEVRRSDRVGYARPYRDQFGWAHWIEPRLAEGLGWELIVTEGRIS